MTLFRLSVVLLSLFSAIVTSVDSQADTHVITRCQYALAFLQPRLIKEVNGNYKLGFKVPPRNRFHADSFDLFLTTDGVEITLTNPLDQGAEVAVATKLFPEIMAQWGFYFRTVKGMSVLHGPGTKGLNKKALALDRTPLAKPFRWVDGFDNANEETRLAGDLVYLKLLSQGKIWLGTLDRPFMHDRFEEHMLAALFMPKDVGVAFQKRLQFLFGLQEIFPGNEFVKKIFASRADELGKLWEDQTSNVGVAIATSAGDFNDLLADHSGLLTGYQSLMGVSAVGEVLAELNQDFARAKIHVTEKQQRQIENLIRRVDYRPLTIQQIRSQIIDEFVYVGIPVRLTK